MSATSDTTVNINTILTFLESIKQENSDDLVNSRGINKINTMIESIDSDLLKKEIKEKITIVDYENALANVYEKITTKSSASNKKLFDLLIELDPLPNYEYKKRISSAAKKYGISEWVQEKLVENPSKKEALLYYLKLLEHGFFPAKFDMLEGESRNEWAKRTMMGQPNNYNKIKSHVMTYAPEEEKKSIEDEQIQELENMYTKICKNRVDNTDDVTNTHNLDPDSDIIVFLMFNKIWCYEKKEIMKSIFNYKSDNLFHKWIKDDNSSDWRIQPTHVNPYFNMNNFDQGYGGKKGKTSYIRLPIGPMGKLLIDIRGIMHLLQYNAIPLELASIDKNSIYDSVITNVFRVTKVMDKERIGSTNTNFGVSETHGQNDTVQIFTIEPTEEDFDSGDPELDSYISYYHENLFELVDKIKFDKEIREKKQSPSDIIFNEIEKLDVSIEVEEEETKKSYMTLFSDPEFIKDIPLNGPQYKKSDEVIINIPEAIENLKCIIKDVFREPEIPSDRKVGWKYFATPSNSRNTSGNTIVLLNETYIQLIDETTQRMNELDRIYNGDDISINEDDEDYQEMMNEMRFDGPLENNPDFIPFRGSPRPTMPRGSLFEDDTPEYRGSPAFSITEPESPIGSPPGTPPRLTMDDLRTNTPPRSSTANRTPPAPRRRRSGMVGLNSESESELESDTEEELGFGGKKVNKKKQTKNNKRAKNMKKKKTIKKKNKKTK